MLDCEADPSEPIEDETGEPTSESGTSDTVAGLRPGREDELGDKELGNLETTDSSCGANSFLPSVIGVTLGRVLRQRLFLRGSSGDARLISSKSTVTEKVFCSESRCGMFFLILHRKSFMIGSAFSCLGNPPWVT